MSEHDGIDLMHLHAEERFQYIHVTTVVTQLMQVVDAENPRIDIFSGEPQHLAPLRVSRFSIAFRAGLHRAGMDTETTPCHDELSMLQVQCMYSVQPIATR